MGFTDVDIYLTTISVFGVMVEIWDKGLYYQLKYITKSSHLSIEVTKERLSQTKGGMNLEEFIIREGHKREVF